jgi:hypothetical protein
MPTTFTLAGGNGTYLASSSDQLVVPNATVSGNALVVVPSAVAAETSVTLTIRDTGTATPITASLTVKPISTAPLSAQPQTLAFQGTAPNTCASGIDADVVVFGGHPPYLISQPAAFQVLPIVVPSNPGRFTIRATGGCSIGSQIAVVDSVGALAIVTATNTLSPVQAPTPPPPVPPPLAVTSPQALTSCSSVSNVTLSGGSGTYFAASGDASVTATVSGNIGSIRRARPSDPTALDSVPVTFSDGKSSVEVRVSLDPGAQIACA